MLSSDLLLSKHAGLASVSLNDFRVKAKLSTATVSLLYKHLVSPFSKQLTFLQLIDY